MSIIDMPSMNIMAAGLHAADVRHQVISNNMANVNTPNFKRSVVKFESLLAEALYPQKTGELRLARTNPRHLCIPGMERLPLRDVHPEIEQISDTTMRTDGNNVDPDREMAGMAKNTLYYNALARQLGVDISNLKLVIKGQ